MKPTIAFLAAALIALVSAAPVHAQIEKCAPGELTRDIEPMEEEILYCHFESWLAVSTFVSANFSLVKTAKPDASPAAIFDSPVVNAKRLWFRIRPNQGCATPNCRQGNYYGGKLIVTTTDGATVTCNLCLRILNTVFVP